MARLTSFGICLMFFTLVLILTPCAQGTFTPWKIAHSLFVRKRLFVYLTFQQPTTSVSGMMLMQRTQSKFIDNPKENRKLIKKHKN
jgi:hypothetical protein